MADKESAIDIIAEKLQLYEIYGQVVASAFLLLQLLPTFVESGVISKEKAEEMINQASANLNASIADIDPEVAPKVKDSAQSVFEGLRKSLK